MGDDYMRMVECGICYSHPINALELDCCEQIICKQCVDEMSMAANVDSKCPLCRKDGYSSHPVKGALKRLIDSMSIPCPNECGKSVKIGNLNDHNRLCPNQPIECKFCSDKFTPPNFFGHLEAKHAADVTSLCRSDKVEVVTSTSATSGGPLVELLTGPSAACSGCVSSGNATVGNLRSRFPVRGSGGVNHPRLGTTGKFYCGRRLDFYCDCCNGNCGPTNGCNCTSCQTLDIQFRRLSPGYYVNSVGMLSYRDTSSNTFYCMRLLEGSSRLNEITCNGVPAFTCRNCKGLNSAWNTNTAFRSVNASVPGRN